MRRLFIILGFIASILAVILSVTPLSKIAYIPALFALVFGLAAFYFSRQKQYPKKSIQLIFLLTIISLILTTYKAIFSVAEVGDLETLEQKEKESEEKAIQELDELNIEDIETNDPDEMPNFNGDNSDQ
ncbi:FUSC family protein [Subsaxibacter sp. CAU 1640]|uniref:FUSC family protein n=1 Tax=Subsaxibacter sp. CAU 1640 TaxID=2933271 RepID=UPI002004AB97|nr:FUSC family protein [Subsaxibacter sp. CAU 1640]MCK7590783.1 FUSC family protein [Subsaxibacter sp. CAU 1640]